jgi:putative transposase
MNTIAGPSACGDMIGRGWAGLAVRFPFVTLDESVVMPNHFHGIVLVPGRGESCIRPESGWDDHTNMGDHKDRPYGTVERSLGRIVQAFKSITTHRYTIGVKGRGWQPFPGRLWQRNYYEQIIRDEDELNRLRQYIVDNPVNWETDEEDPNRIRMWGHPSRVPLI